ncbi:MAG TPA: DNA polymerase III subunit gamma/tau, partial [Actinomycetota bacterium]|nr:DNA polymerase III subunit gamma/tau [Actinomycetota bacterium]
MAYLSLYRKYRPQTFKEILGQDHVARTLANAITEGRVAHAYLFTGPRGTGKTSTARILAKALNCEKGPTPEPCGVCNSCIAIAEGSSLDVFELDAASHSGVDETREILSGVPLATAGGRKKVYVIDEVHMLTTQSFNALLKTLEEPPEHVVFVLATTEAHKVLPTIVSRTQRFDFRRASAEVIEAHLAEIAKLENIDADPEALAVIARHAEGSFRDALASLEQLGSLGDGISIDDAERQLGERDDDALFEVFDAVASGDLGSVFSTIHSLVAQGADVRQVTLSAMNLARSVLLLRTAVDAASLLDASETDRARMAGLAERFGVPWLVRMLDLLGKALTEMRNAPNHRLLLEVALVRAAAPDTDPSATGLQGRLERLERRIGIEGPAPAGSAAPSEPV